MQVVTLLALAFHQTGTAVAPTAGDPNDGRIYLWIAIGVAVFALLVAFLMARAVIAADSGTADMQVISNAIREGAEAFLKRQYQTIGMIALLLMPFGLEWLALIPMGWGAEAILFVARTATALPASTLDVPHVTSTPKAVSVTTPEALTFTVCVIWSPVVTIFALAP